MGTLPNTHCLDVGVYEREKESGKFVFKFSLIIFDLKSDTKSIG